MADTPDTPEPAAKPNAPATRRRAPRTTSTAKTPAKTSAVKPSPSKSATPRPAASRADAVTPAPAPAATPKRATAPKPRSTKRAAPAQKRRAAPKVVEKPAAKSGRRWVKAALVGSLAAVGAAATAALLSLRGSTSKDASTDADPVKHAHTADGTDASKSFEAGIADENTIPDKT